MLAALLYNFLTDQHHGLMTVVHHFCVSVFQGGGKSLLQLSC